LGHFALVVTVIVKTLKQRISDCTASIILRMLTLEALAMDNGWSTLVILLLGDPHLLEGGEGSQDGTTDPDGVLAFWRSDDLDLHRGRGEGSDFLLHAVGDTWVHGGTTGLGFC
jgi:hypothetical protein